MKNLGIREDDIDVQRMWSWNELADQYLLEAEDDLAALNQSVWPQMVKEFIQRYKTELLTMWETEEYKKLPPLA